MALSLHAHQGAAGLVARAAPGSVRGRHEGVPPQAHLVAQVQLPAPHAVAHATGEGGRGGPEGEGIHLRLGAVGRLHGKAHAQGPALGEGEFAGRRVAQAALGLLAADGRRHHGTRNHQRGLGGQRKGGGAHVVQIGLPGEELVEALADAQRGAGGHRELAAAGPGAGQAHQGCGFVIQAEGRAAQAVLAVVEAVAGQHPGLQVQGAGHAGLVGASKGPAGREGIAEARAEGGQHLVPLLVHARLEEGLGRIPRAHGQGGIRRQGRADLHLRGVAHAGHARANPHRQLGGEGPGRLQLCTVASQVNGLPEEAASALVRQDAVAGKGHVQLEAEAEAVRNLEAPARAGQEAVPVAGLEHPAVGRQGLLGTGHLHARGQVGLAAGAQGGQQGGVQGRGLQALAEGHAHARAADAHGVRSRKPRGLRHEGRSGKPRQDPENRCRSLAHHASSPNGMSAPRDIKWRGHAPGSKANHLASPEWRSRPRGMPWRGAGGPLAPRGSGFP